MLPRLLGSNSYSSLPVLVLEKKYLILGMKMEASVLGPAKYLAAL